MNRRELRGSDGTLLATYAVGARRTADGAAQEVVLEAVDPAPDADLDAVAAAAVRAWPGEQLRATTPALAEAAQRAGARLARQADILTLAVPAAPPAPIAPPPGVTLHPLTEVPDGLGAVSARAFGRPDHPDHDGNDAAAEHAALRHLWAGSLGPALPAGRLARGPDGGPVGATMLVDRSDHPTLPGAWLVQCFRDPDPRWRGAGAALLTASIAALAASGPQPLTLAVTEGNPARRLYARAGFVRAQTAWTLRLPGERRPERTIQ